MNAKQAIHDHFRSTTNWRADALVCVLLAAAVTPPDPESFLTVAIPLTSTWMVVRYVVAHRSA